MADPFDVMAPDGMGTLAVFSGTSGNDSIVGTSADDDFRMGQGGDDTVLGGDGTDIFYFGRTFDGNDEVDGGDGTDTLVLNGDYSKGIVFTAQSLSNIESIDFLPGNSYALSGLTDVNNTSFMTIDGSRLTSTDHLTFDASQLNSTIIRLIGGAGDDVLTGGASNDILTGNAGDDVLRGGPGNDSITAGDGDDTLGGGIGNDTIVAGSGADSIEGGVGDDWISLPKFNSADSIDGGDGHDTVVLSTTDTSSIWRIHGANFSNVEYLGLNDSIEIIVTSDVVAKGAVLEVQEYGSRIYFDGHVEKHGSFYLDSNFGGTMIGGNGDDTLLSDTISHTAFFEGGKGADVISGVGVFFYRSILDSTPTAPDEIKDVTHNDVIDLHMIDADNTVAGNQPFQRVAAFDGHAGELVVDYDHARNLTDVEADVNGDGVADFVITIDGKHTDFTNFVL